eukprot:bmy_18986T0
MSNRQLKVCICENSEPPVAGDELEARHQNNIFIDDISDIVEKHTASTFDPYVKYCTNEVYQQRTLQKLLATNPSFKEVLSRIESHEDCRNLPMISFLILPMQRVTRLPLLMDTICQKTPKDSSKYEVCKRALKEVSKIFGSDAGAEPGGGKFPGNRIVQLVQSRVWCLRSGAHEMLVRLCNEGARKMERTEMMYTINSQLEFKIKFLDEYHVLHVLRVNGRPFPLVSSSRWLVKRGELTAYVEDTGLFSKRTSKQQVYFFLFNDVLIITKKKRKKFPRDWEDVSNTAILPASGKKVNPLTIRKKFKVSISSGLLVSHRIDSLFCQISEGYVIGLTTLDEKISECHHGHSLLSSGYAREEASVMSDSLLDLPISSVSRTMGSGCPVAAREVPGWRIWRSVVTGMGAFWSCCGSSAIFLGDTESQQILTLPTNVTLFSTICYFLNNEIGSEELEGLLPICQILALKESSRTRQGGSEESYNVNDYSLRDQLLVESCDSEEVNSSLGKNSSAVLYSRQNSASHLFTLTVLSNHVNEKVEMLLGAETQSERARWITALGHSSGKQPPDRTSLTQVEIIRSFTAKQPDELSLQVADVVLIYQCVSDGWYEGERLRDGERGWFPMECAKEITCQATIDKNVERMGRLLGLETNV